MRIARSLSFLLLLAGNACAVVVVDDNGTSITIEQPARRIISLSPHNTELLFAAGAGDRVIAAVDYSDYPEQAGFLPRVGRAAALDIERIAALKPDVVIGWGSGNPQRQLDAIRRLKIPLFISEPRNIDDIAGTLRRLGSLVGTEDMAERAAGDFDRRLADLRKRYSSQPVLTVFYEVWNQPLMTVGGKHVISQIIELCGGRNVFADNTQLAPALDTEAVLRANPEVIVASGMDINRPEWLDEWRRWPALRANATDNLYAIPPDLLHRHTPRILDGAQQMCAALESARTRHKKLTTGQAGK
jgi:iron complex transport system substrate-binding protein